MTHELRNGHAARNGTFTIAEAARAFRQARGSAPKCESFDGGEDRPHPRDGTARRRRPATRRAP